MFGILLAECVSDLDEVANVSWKELHVWFNLAFGDIVFVGRSDCVDEDLVGCVYVICVLHAGECCFYFLGEAVPVGFPVVSV